MQSEFLSGCDVPHELPAVVCPHLQRTRRDSIWGRDKLVVWVTCQRVFGARLAFPAEAAQLDSCLRAPVTFIRILCAQKVLTNTARF